MIALALAAALGSTSPAPASAVEPSASHEAVRPIAAIVLDGDHIDAELQSELALRASTRELVRSETITELPSARFVWLTVAWIDAERARLELVDTDGRAYERVVTAPADQLRRAIAGTTASMVAAIERGEIVADRSGVAITLPAPPSPPAVAQPPAVVATAPPPAPPQSDPPPRWELGPHVVGGIALGFGPPLDLDGYVGAGGRVGLDARHRSGALVGASARVLGHAHDGLALVRIRVAITGGYALRRKSFELLVRGGVSIEPLVLRDRGASVRTLATDGTATRTAPLVGALVGLAPGVLLRPRRSKALLRISLDLELAGAMEARKRPGVARWIDGTTSTSLLRAGGLELGLGLGFGGWFAIDRRE